MKLSYNWLKKIIGFDLSPDNLAVKLTSAGIEIASIDPFGSNLDNVFAAKVLDVKPHHESSNLKICRIDAGHKDYSVVCGAPNVSVGQTVPLAISGAVLPNGQKIGETNISGVVSDGMICSEKELGIGDDDAGILVLDDSIKIGSNLKDLEGLVDTIMEIEVTPNRPDCLSHLGIAREIAVFTGLPVNIPENDFVPSSNESIPITVNDSELCGSYCAFIIKGVKVEQSPFWLASALKRIGLRPVNNVVDITNYVLMEMGHPLHAFDLDKLSGREIIVRTAMENEKIVTLDAKERVLNKSMLVIADSKNPVALAGVMGGANSEVSEDTKNILLEGAYFNPVSVRRASKQTGLSTEASYRFERGTDRVGFKEALKRAAYLIHKICGAESVSGMIECEAKPVEKNIVTCDIKNIISCLGFEIPKDKIIGIIKNLQMNIIEQRGDILVIEVPSFRVDIAIEEDIVEEIARVYGYDNIPAIDGGSEFVEFDVNHKLLFSRITSNLLIGSGFYEVISCSLVDCEANKIIPSFFINDKDISAINVVNPISEAQQTLQTSLVPNLLGCIELNARQKQTDVKIFEIGNVFLPDKNRNAREKLLLAVAVSGLKDSFSWQRDGRHWDFYSFKGLLEDYLDGIGLKNYYFQKSSLSYTHPGRTAIIMIGEQTVGFIGQVHPILAKDKDIDSNTFIAELDADIIISNLNLNPKFKPLPKYPSVDRDLAVIIDKNMEFSAIYDTLIKSLPGVLEDFMVVSVYEGKQIPVGKKSLNLRMRYRSLEKTLTDSEVSAMHTNLAKILVEKLGCELR